MNLIIHEVDEVPIPGPERFKSYTSVKSMKSPEDQQKFRDHKRRKKIDNLFEIPLITSIMMLAMAHGSNEINVSAPLLAEIFLLDGSTKTILAQ